MEIPANSPFPAQRNKGFTLSLTKSVYNLYSRDGRTPLGKSILPDGTKTPIDRNDLDSWRMAKEAFDFAYITIHGTPVRTVSCKVTFDLLGIPYSSCNVLVSAITFNKFHLQPIFERFGIRYPESLILRKGLKSPTKSNQQNRSALFYQTECRRFQLWRNKSQNRRRNSACHRKSLPWKRWSDDRSLYERYGSNLRML